MRNHIEMIAHHLKFFLRKLYQRKFYMLLSLLSLSIGSASCLFLYKNLEYELSFDTFHQNYDDIYRVINNRNVENDDYSGVTPYRLADGLKGSFPQIKDVLRITPNDEVIQYDNMQFKEENIYFADPGFFDFFSFQLFAGTKDCLKNPNSIVLTKPMAQRIFGSKNPLGEILNINNQYDLTVTGILDDCSQGTHLNFNAIIPMDIFVKQQPEGVLEFWDYNRFYTYILVNNNFERETFDNNLTSYIKEHVPPNVSDYTNYILQELGDIRFYSEDIKFDVINKSGISYIFILIIAAIAILFVSTTNYLNLSTAIADTRVSEICIRKVYGAGRRSIFYQIFFESFLLSLFSTILTSVIVRYTLDNYNVIINEKIHVELDVGLIIAMVLTVFVLSFISGLYPAIYSSSFKPAFLLKNRSANGFSKSYLRKALVVFQFAITFNLIVVYIFFDKQLQFILNKELNYDSENIAIFVPDQNTLAQYQAFKNTLEQNPNIQNVCRSSVALPHRLGKKSKLKIRDSRYPNNREKIAGRVIGADFDFIDTYGFELIDGRSFHKDFPHDSGASFIINEAMVNELKETGIKDPIGLSIKFREKTGQIIGVVKDFHYWSLHEKIEPVVIFINPGFFWHVIVKMNTHDKQTKKFVSEKWNEFAPDYPFHVSEISVQDNIDQLYVNEKQLTKIIRVSMVLSILLSSLGLLSLITFVIGRSMKEISIRKILGASKRSLLFFLMREFYVLSVIAIFLSVPISYLFLQDWFGKYFYNINLDAGTYVYSAILLWSLIFVSIYYQINRVTKSNPVNTLRSE